MSSDHQFGEAINILSFNNSKEIVVDDSELDKIFGYPEIQDRKVVILSIIGAFRGGKSFFLDYCLRFLYAHVSDDNLLSCQIVKYFIFVVPVHKQSMGRLSVHL